MRVPKNECGRLWMRVEVKECSCRRLRRGMTDVDVAKFRALWRSEDTAGYIKSDEEEEVDDRCVAGYDVANVDLPAVLVCTINKCYGTKGWILLMDG